MKCKRLIAFAVLIVMLAAALPLSALAETYATVISSDVLHLRSTPDGQVGWNIIGRYRNGTRVTILKTGKRWSKVRTPDGKTGYMYNDYLSSFKSSGGSSGGGSGNSGTWTGTAIRYIKSGIGPVNFRKNASVNSKLLDQLPGGTMVTLLTEGSVWSRVRYNGTLGWIKTRYLVKTRK